MEIALLSLQRNRELAIEKIKGCVKYFRQVDFNMNFSNFGLILALTNKTIILIL